MKKRNPMTRERNRTERLIKAARQSDQQCYVWLHIVNGPSRMDILDELCEDFMRATKRITFPTVEIPEMPCIRSEREYCIVPEDAIIIGGELPRDVSLLKRPTRLDNTNSPIWHFAGDIQLIHDKSRFCDPDQAWRIDKETCFCEYDTDKREGGMIIFFDGKDIPQLLMKYPQLKEKIKIAKRKQFNWLITNW